MTKYNWVLRITGANKLFDIDKRYDFEQWSKICRHHVTDLRRDWEICGFQVVDKKPISGQFKLDLDENHLVVVSEVSLVNRYWWVGGQHYQSYHLGNYGNWTDSTWLGETSAFYYGSIEAPQFTLLELYPFFVFQNSTDSNVIWMRCWERCEYLHSISIRFRELVKTFGIDNLSTRIPEFFDLGPILFHRVTKTILKYIIYKVYW